MAHSRMNKIKPDARVKLLSSSSGIAFTILGLVLFSKTLFAGYFEIIPLVFSLVFITFGVLSIYYGVLYEIIIDDLGLKTGSIFVRNNILKEEIIGYFLLKTPLKGAVNTKVSELLKDRSKVVSNPDVLVILLRGERKKGFSLRSLGKNFKTLREEISRRYKLLPPIERIKMNLEKKKSGYKWASYLGIGILVFGTTLLFSSIEKTYDNLILEGTLNRKPELNYNKQNQASRIHVYLNEYPNISFSQVKNVNKFKNWAKKVKVGKI